MDSDKLTCKQINPLLSAFRDGETMADEQRVVSEHLAGCDKCQADLESLNAIADELKSLGNASLPAGFEQRLDKALDAKVYAKRSVVSIKIWAPAAVAAAIVAIVGLTTIAPQSSTHVAQKPEQQEQPEVTKTAQRTEVAANPDKGTSERQEQQQEAESSNQREVNNPSGTTIKRDPLPFKYKTRIAQNENQEAAAPLIAAQDDAPFATISSAATDGSTDTDLALFSDDSSFNDTVGIATDEDGLYDLKI